MAPLPKRKRSRARKRSRQAHSALHLVNLGRCPQCRNPKLPHRACGVCGTYAGRQVIAVETEQG